MGDEANVAPPATPPADPPATPPVPPPATPPVVPPGTPPADPQPVDLTKFAADLRVKYTQKAETDFNNKLVETFGTSEWEKIQEAWAGKAPPETKLLQETIQDKVSMLAKIQAEQQQLQLENSMLLKMPGNVRDKKILIQMAKNEYDFRDVEGILGAFQKGTETPVLSNDTGKQFSFSDIMEQWQKSPERNFLYKHEETLQPPAGEPGASSPKDNLRLPEKHERSDPEFQRGVRRSNQWHAFMSGKPIDIEAVHRK